MTDPVKKRHVCNTIPCTSSDQKKSKPSPSYPSVKWGRPSDRRRHCRLEWRPHRTHREVRGRLQVCQRKLWSKRKLLKTYQTGTRSRLCRGDCIRPGLPNPRPRVRELERRGHGAGERTHSILGVSCRTAWARRDRVYCCRLSGGPQVIENKLQRFHGERNLSELVRS